MRKKLAAVAVLSAMCVASLSGCGSDDKATTGSAATTAAATEAKTAETPATTAISEGVTEVDTSAANDDKAKADEVAALIDKIYVQERTDTTDADCKAAKEAWDKKGDKMGFS
jgi:hypothetical protein